MTPRARSSRPIGNPLRSWKSLQKYLFKNAAVNFTPLSIPPLWRSPGTSPSSPHPATDTTSITQQWLEALPAVGDAILRADLDFYNLVFSNNMVGRPDQNSRLRRFSEYNPKKQGAPKPTAEIDPGIFGRAHAEIRPVRGSGESLITRVTLDYQGGEVRYLLPPIKGIKIGHLEIDCFTAVTPPTMEYDFSRGRLSVTDIKRDGNIKYENACIKRKPGEDIRRTPFYSKAPPPPKVKGTQNPDWMFYFQPMESTWLQTIVRRYINRKNKKNMGGLFLWANNPTFGFTDPKHYEKLGVRYNTMPRKFGDLIRFFSPMFDAKTRSRLLQEAPFLNPNTEYLGADGKRHRIPKDPLEVAKLNKSRVPAGLPPVPRRRGPAVDWIFTEFLGDPKKLALTPLKHWPSVKMRLQFKPGTVLDLPIGKVKIDSATQVLLSYQLKPIREKIDGKERVRAKAIFQVQVSPLKLNNTQIHLGALGLKVKDSLYADEFKFTLPIIQEYSKNGVNYKMKPHWEQMAFSLKGLRATGLEVHDGIHEVTYRSNEVKLPKLTFFNDKSWSKANLKNLQAKGLEVIHEMGRIRFSQGNIPQIKMQTRHDLSNMKIRVPTIASQGKISIQPNLGTKTTMDLNGTTTINKLWFGRRKENGKYLTTLRFKIDGVVERAQVENSQYGKVNLSMIEGKKTHHLQGKFNAAASQPGVPGGEPQLDYHLSLKIPYTTFDLSSPIAKLPRKASTLRNGTVRVGKDLLSLEGDLKLVADEITVPESDLIRWKDLKVIPHLEDVLVTGSALFEWTQEGIRLRKHVGGALPLSARFRLTDSQITYTPPVAKKDLKSHPEKQVIQTQLDIKDAHVVVEEVQDFQFETAKVDGKAQGTSVRFEAGPLVIHNIKGGGEIWIDAPLWGWQKGTFPHFGVPLKEIPTRYQSPRPKNYPRPQPEKILGHLPSETKQLLWDKRLGTYSNFLYLDRISVGPDPRQPEDPGRSQTILKDLLIFAHETGHFWQFATVGIPKLKIDQRKSKNGEIFVRIGTGSQKIFNHIVIKDPKRGYQPMELKTRGPYQAPFP